MSYVFFAFCFFSRNTNRLNYFYKNSSLYFLPFRIIVKLYLEIILLFSIAQKLYVQTSNYFYFEK
jgi:hypothetical protein